MGKEWGIGKSRELYDRAKQSVPGGASDSARCYPYFIPHPIFLDRGKGARVYDVDGNEYIDYHNCFGSTILGHTHPKIVEAIKQQLEKGTMFVTPHELEIKLAEKVKRLIPTCDMIRFVSSGSEATMHAIRLARAYTGKNKIIKFEGHYHGHHDTVCVSHTVDPEHWGTRIAPTRIPLSAGIPEDTLKNVIPLPWNDVRILEKNIKRHAHELAAVITEPVMGNGGMVFPQKGYLEAMRELTTENDVVLIFDEIITGFRMPPGSAQQFFGVKPDLSTFSKALGGGCPVAAFGGKEEIMDQLTPKASGGLEIFHAGTYNANPLSLAGACATVDELSSNDGRAFQHLRRIGEKLIGGLRDLAEREGQRVLIPGFAGFFVMLFTEKSELKDWRDVILNVDVDKSERFAWEAIKRGVYLTPKGWERWHPSIVHSDEDIERTLVAAEGAFRAIK